MVGPNEGAKTTYLGDISQQFFMVAIFVVCVARQPFTIISVCVVGVVIIFVPIPAFTYLDLVIIKVVLTSWTNQQRQPPWRTPLHPPLIDC